MAENPTEAESTSSTPTKRILEALGVLNSLVPQQSDEIIKLQKKLIKSNYTVSRLNNRILGMENKLQEQDREGLKWRHDLHKNAKYIADLKKTVSSLRSELQKCKRSLTEEKELRQSEQEKMKVMSRKISSICPHLKSFISQFECGSEASLVSSATDEYEEFDILIKKCIQLWQAAGRNYKEQARKAMESVLEQINFTPVVNLNLQSDATANANTSSDDSTNYERSGQVACSHLPTTSEINESEPIIAESTSLPIVIQGTCSLATDQFQLEEILHSPTCAIPSDDEQSSIAGYLTDTAPQDEQGHPTCETEQFIEISDIKMRSSPNCKALSSSSRNVLASKITQPIFQQSTKIKKRRKKIAGGYHWGPVPKKKPKRLTAQQQSSSDVIDPKRTQIDESISKNTYTQEIFPIHSSLTTVNFECMNLEHPNHALDMSKEQADIFCCICGLLFTSKNAVAAHVQFFALRRKFLCDICKEHDFWNIGDLMKHKRNYHEQDASGRRGCQSCGIVFATMKEWAKHRVMTVSEGGAIKPLCPMEILTLRNEQTV